jgi:hypothetical protein
MDTATLLNEDFFTDLEFDENQEEESSELSLVPTKGKPQWLPAEHVPNVNPWDPRLVLDLALAIEDTEPILERYDLQQEDYDALMRTPSFRRDLALTMREVRENGLSFRHKARVQAESYLEVLDQLVYSPATPASTRLDGIKQAVTWGDLSPKEGKGGDVQNAQQINISINF